MNLAIIGNMGAGKTTVCKFIAENYKYNYVAESTENNPFLAPGYADRTKFNFYLQMYFLFERYSSNVSNREGRNVFDRTFFDGPEVFAKVHHKMGNLTDLEFNLIQFGYNALKKSIATHDRLIYLKSTPAKCREHVVNRGNPYEATLQLDFLIELDAAYDRFFKEYDLGPKIKIISDDFNLKDVEALKRITDLCLKL